MCIYNYIDIDRFVFWFVLCLGSTGLRNLGLVSLFVPLFLPLVIVFVPVFAGGLIAMPRFLGLFSCAMPVADVFCIHQDVRKVYSVQYI